MSSVKIALAAGLAVIAVGLGLMLSSTPVSVAHTSSSKEENLGYTGESHTLCQSGETLPQGTTAVRLQLGTFTGPRLTLRVFAGTKLIDSGERGSGWTGRTVTIALRSVPSHSSVVRLCVGWAMGGSESIHVMGALTEPSRALRIDGAPERGRFGVEYLRSGRSSWLSLAPGIAHRLGLGRSPSGTWIAVLAALVMLAVVAISSRVIVGEIK